MFKDFHFLKRKLEMETMFTLAVSSAAVYTEMLQRPSRPKPSAEKHIHFSWSCSRVGEALKAEKLQRDQVRPRGRNMAMVDTCRTRE